MCVCVCIVYRFSCNLDYVTDEVCAALRYSVLRPAGAHASITQLDARLPLVVESVLSTLSPDAADGAGQATETPSSSPSPSPSSSRSADLLRSLLRDLMTNTVEAVDSFASLDGRPSKQVSAPPCLAPTIMLEEDGWMAL